MNFITTNQWKFATSILSMFGATSCHVIVNNNMARLKSINSKRTGLVEVRVKLRDDLDALETKEEEAKSIMIPINEDFNSLIVSDVLLSLDQSGISVKYKLFNLHLNALKGTLNVKVPSCPFYFTSQGSILPMIILSSIFGNVEFKLEKKDQSRYTFSLISSNDKGFSSMAHEVIPSGVEIPEVIYSTFDGELVRSLEKVVNRPMISFSLMPNGSLIVNLELGNERTPFPMDCIIAITPLVKTE